MRFVFLILFITFTITFVMAANYKVYTSGEYDFQNPQEKTLFILDFSSSMTEMVSGRRKIDMMMDTMNTILPKISPNAEVGLRVYGHRLGLTAFDACRASKLAVAISCGNSVNIQKQLQKIKPYGMTPITYSLKQAINHDFKGYIGQKHIILLTDGGENCDESPCEYAMKVMKEDETVKIDVIAFDIRNEDDLAQLECASMVTRGHFYTANTVGELINSLNNSLNIKKDVEGKIISH